MNLEDSLEIILHNLELMNDKYGHTVFDEIAIVNLKDNHPEFYYYKGPRGSSFSNEFMDNSCHIREELKESHSNSGGEFYFTNEGAGVYIDACIRIGSPHVYLFCNNVKKSMVQIREDSNWEIAKPHFLEISLSFSLNPLSVSLFSL